MTPELQSLPETLPPTLRWRHTQRRTAWLFDGTTCIGSLGFGGYGRASGVTSHGVWHLQRLGVLHLGVTVAPADRGRAPLLMKHAWDFSGTLTLACEAVQWRSSGAQSWCFERERDRVRYFGFTPCGRLHTETDVEVGPAAASLADPSPLLLLGAFLVRLAVDDLAVVAGASS